MKTTAVERPVSTRLVVYVLFPHAVKLSKILVRCDILRYVKSETLFVAYILMICKVT